MVRKGAGGRPRSPEVKSTLSTWLPASTHDQYIQAAKTRETSVSALVAQVLILNIVNIFPNR
jgi:hypothetical protein